SQCPLPVTRCEPGFLTSAATNVASISKMMDQSMARAGARGVGYNDRSRWIPSIVWRRLAIGRPAGSSVSEQANGLRSTMPDTCVVGTNLRIVLAVTIGHSRYRFGSLAARSVEGTPQQTPGCLEDRGVCGTNQK